MPVITPRKSVILDPCLNNFNDEKFCQSLISFLVHSHKKALNMHASTQAASCLALRGHDFLQRQSFMRRAFIRSAGTYSSLLVALFQHSLAALVHSVYRR